MTVVPGTAGTPLIICDSCGTEQPTDATVRDQDVVWPAVWTLDWTGSPFATGPHLCPGCSSTTPAPMRERTARTQGASYAIRTDHDGRTCVITPLTDLDAALAERIRDDLMRTAALHQHVVVDLHAVEFVDSAGLGLLVRGRQQARRHGASFDLAAPSRFVLTVLHTMRLDGAFRIFPDLAGALAALGRQHAGGHPA